MSSVTASTIAARGMPDSPAGWGNNCPWGGRSCNFASRSSAIPFSSTGGIPARQSRRPETVKPASIMALSLASGLGQKLDEGLPILGSGFAEGGVGDLRVSRLERSADFFVGQPTYGLILD